MRVYWQAAKQGLRLVLADGEREERIGGVRETRQGFDAFAMTFGYDPDRARRAIASLDGAKAFVESFRHGSFLPVTRSFQSSPTCSR